METQTMNVLKQASLEIIKRLPNECTIDDIKMIWGKAQMSLTYVL
jgi:hypothetical protein